MPCDKKQKDLLENKLQNCQRENAKRGSGESEYNGGTRFICLTWIDTSQYD